MAAGFEPTLTVLSLLLIVTGVSAGVGLEIGRRKRSRRFLAGPILGLGLAGCTTSGRHRATM
jgi:NO-binding membrane sensor protein with MHYT domain